MLTKIENKSRMWVYSMLMIFVFVLYGNTLGHQYAQDDAIVIYDNMFTQEGISGIGGHLSNDTFYGFFKKEGKANLVSGGRYRPLTPILFSIEYQLFGKRPFFGHLGNILWYGFLGMAIFNLLILLLKDLKDIDNPNLFALVVTLLFLAHPVHTEAVANIKGRDEILSMLGGVLAFIGVLRYIDTKAAAQLGIAFLGMFLGLMSKENTITFLAVIPLGVLLFRAGNTSKLVYSTLAILAGALVFMAIRTSILGFDIGGKPMELMNNPFLKWTGNGYTHFTSSEKAANILTCLGKYLGLMVFPWHLIHDYYPKSIDVLSMSDWKAVSSLFLHLGLLGVAAFSVRRIKLVTFGILYYFMTLSIVSNIVFPIGTNMSERFLFMPSLGLILAAAAAIHTLLPRKLTLVVGGLALLFFSIRTIVRNPVWYDDYTLFTTDVKQGTQSAKLLNAAGGALISKSFDMLDGPKKTQDLTQAVNYLHQAIEIHPTYKNPQLLLGNGYFYLKDYEKSIAGYEAALQLDPDFAEARNNLPLVLRDAARYAGEKEQDIPKALRYLKQSIQLNPDDLETNRLIGISYGMSGDHANAIKYFTKVVDLSPENATAYVNLGIAYRNSGDETKARINLERAVAIDPNALNKLQ